MIIAGIQTDIAWEEPTENFSRVRRLTEQAVEQGARFVVVPEMFATGFSMNAAEVATFSGVTHDFLAAESARLGIYLLGGYAMPAAPRPRNVCSLFDPEGDELLRYAKIHPFSLAGEQEHYDGGRRIFTAEVEGLRVTPLICYDLRFPEPFRTVATQTDLYIVIANWGARRRKAWQSLLVARAIENQAFVLGVNRVGEGGGETYAGDSVLLDPFGEVRATAGPESEPAIFMADIDPAEVTTARADFSFLADRRKDVYRDLEG